MKIHIFSAMAPLAEHMEFIQAIAQFGSITMSGTCDSCDICIFLTEPFASEMTYGAEVQTYFYVTCDLLNIHKLQYEKDALMYRNFKYILLPNSYEYQRHYLELFYKASRIIQLPDIYSKPVKLEAVVQEKEPALATTILIRQKNAKALFHLLDEYNHDTIDTIYWIQSDINQKEYNKRFSFADKIRYFTDCKDDDILQKFKHMNKVIFLEHNTNNSLHLRLQLSIHKIYVLSNRPHPYTALYNDATFVSQLKVLASSDTYEYSNKALQYAVRSTKEHYVDSFLKSVPFTTCVITIICVNEERKAFMSKQMDELNISVPVIFIEAFTPSNSKEFLNDTYGHEKKQCCFRSHVECLKTFQQYKEIPYLIVLEDDVLLCKDFEAQLPRIVEAYKANAAVEFVSLGYIPIQKNELTKFQTDGKLYWSNEKVWGTQALLYNHAAATKALPLFNKPTAKEIVVATNAFVKEGKHAKEYPHIWCGPDTILNIVLKQAIVWPPIAIESTI